MTQLGELAKLLDSIGARAEEGSGGGGGGDGRENHSASCLRAWPGLKTGSHPDPRSPSPTPGLSPAPVCVPPDGSVARELVGLCPRERPGLGTVRPARLRGCPLGEGFGRVSPSFEGS